MNLLRQDLLILFGEPEFKQLKMGVSEKTSNDKLKARVEKLPALRKKKKLGELGDQKLNRFLNDVLKQLEDVEDFNVIDSTADLQKKAPAGKKAGAKKAAGKKAAGKKAAGADGYVLRDNDQKVLKVMSATEPMGPTAIRTAAGVSAASPILRRLIVAGFVKPAAIKGKYVKIKE